MYVTIITERKLRPTSLPRRFQSPIIIYSVWRDLQGSGDDRIGYLEWQKSIKANAPWEQRQLLAREQETVAHRIAAGVAP